VIIQQTQHIKRKHSVIAAALIILFISSTKAGQQQAAFVSKQLVADTTVKKDSMAIMITDPKLGFRDLFTHSTLGEGISSEQLNPKAISFVEDYIEKNRDQMEDMKDWGKPYFDMMDNVLTQHGLPKELKYLAVIESRLKASARSWVGAVGPWQFMPATARNMGLKVSRSYDERTDYYKSTHAASRYLTNLYSIYGDWLLVIAAYNGGPGNVNSAIKRAGSKDFWKLQNYLPAESRNHVKKFIATHYIMEGQGGVTTLTRNELKDLVISGDDRAALLTADEIANSTILKVSGRYNSLILARHISINTSLFNRMNPNFDQVIADAGEYELRLPNNKIEVFHTKKKDILAESIQLLLSRS
jgi:membrane-bound lytic murein transglycosylase D